MEAYQPLNATEVDEFVQWHEQHEIRITLMVAEIVLCTFIVVTNSLVLLLFYLERKSYKISHMYIISMALSDLLQGLANPGIHLYLISGTKVGEPSCLFLLALGIYVLLNSLFTILTTSIDRYWAIVHPVSYKTKATHVIATIIISSGWLLSMALGALLFIFNRIPDDPNILCLVFTERFSVYYQLAVVFLIVLPAIFAVSFIYCRIYHVIMDSMGIKCLNERMDHLRKIVRNEVSPTDKGHRERNREIRTTVVLFMTVILYAICYIPGIILLFCFLTDPHSASISGILTVYVLNHINSAIDPFLYAYNLRGAPAAVRRLIRRTTWISSSISSEKSTVTTISAGQSGL